MATIEFEQKNYTDLVLKIYLKEDLVLIEIDNVYFPTSKIELDKGQVLELVRELGEWL